MKKIKKALGIALFFGIGIACVFALSLRARQIDNNSTYNDRAYYEYEISHQN